MAVKYTCDNPKCRKQVIFDEVTISDYWTTRGKYKAIHTCPECSRKAWAGWRIAINIDIATLEAE